VAVYIECVVEREKEVLDRQIEYCKAFATPALRWLRLIWRIVASEELVVAQSSVAKTSWREHGQDLCTARPSRNEAFLFMRARK
jgi:hypothetical protein